MRKFKNILLSILTVLSFFCNAQSPKIDSLKNSLSSQKEDIGKIRTYDRIYDEYIDNDPIEALKYTTEALKLARKISNKKEIAEQLLSIGYCHELSGNNEKALEYYWKTFRVGEEINDKRIMARAYQNIGVFYYFKSNYTQAIVYYQKALELKESIDDKRGVADLYINIGALNREQQNMDKAEENYLLAQKLYLEINDKSGLSTCYNNLGIVFRNQNEHEKAIAYYNKAIELNNELGDEKGTSNALNNIGLCYNSLGKYKQALEFHKKALDVELRFNNQREAAGSYINIGETYTYLNDYPKAIKYLELGARISEKNGSKYYLQYAYSGLTNVYEKLGNYRMSVNYHKLYAEIKDSLLNEEKSKQLAELQTKYETSKKEKEIELLTKENQIQLLENDNKEYEIKKRTILIYSILGALLLFTFFSIALLKAYKEKKKANLIISQQKDEVENQKSIVEEKNKNILDSIAYARTLQEAVLPEFAEISEFFPDYFIFYKPKDIVSGDFYWFHQGKNKTVIAVADCTGHGVPGALMSMMGNALLSEIIKEKNIQSPGIILEMLNNRTISLLREKSNIHAHSDGMDISICTFDFEKNELEFSGANHSLLVVSNNQISEIKGDIFSIGGIYGKQEVLFTNNKIKLEKGMNLYLSTDGYRDQFGGEKRTKFMTGRFKSLLLDASIHPCNVQLDMLSSAFESWKSSNTQIDDVLVWGIKI